MVRTRKLSVMLEMVRLKNESPNINLQVVQQSVHKIVSCSYGKHPFQVEKDYKKEFSETFDP